MEQALRPRPHADRRGDVDIRWSSASWPGSPSDPLPTDPDWAGGSLYEDERSTPVDASPEALWRVIEGIGGDSGWYSFPLAWRVRGMLDRAVGGVGLRRGRRDPSTLFVGEALDFWRVEERLPGQAAAAARRDAPPRTGLAGADVGVEQGDREHGVHRVRAACDVPSAWPARTAYWWAVAPFHGIVFGSMARNIARAAEAVEPVDAAQTNSESHAPPTQAIAQ